VPYSTERMNIVGLKVSVKKYVIVVLSLLIISSSLGESSGAFLSPQEETQLGDRFLISIASHYKLSDYPYIVRYINDLGTYLGDQIEVPYFPLNFYVVQENAINAFAAPAGHVFTFSGLIKVMDNVDELASVLAHELGHVSARHLAERVERSKKIGIATMAGILAGILAGGEAAGALMTGSIAAGIQAELGYSREDERQADQLGFKYAHRSGFDPRGMVSVLKKIQREGWYATGGIPPYLLTHPGAPERMATIEGMLQGYEGLPDTERTGELRADFPVFRTMVIALCHDKEEARKEFRERLSTDPESTMAHYGLGLVLDREGLTDEALSHLEIALRQKPGSVPIMYAIGEAYQKSGHYQNAISILEKALERSPNDKEIMYLLALSFQNLEQYTQASDIYEKLTFLPPVKDRVYYNLGLVYGRQGKLALAHYNLGIYFTTLRRREEALFHFKTASELAGSAPALKEKIDKALKNLKGP
jgi:predicted Zn-dependent protease